MTKLRLVSSLAFLTLLVSCSSNVPLPDTRPAASANGSDPGQSAWIKQLKTGNFHCELGQRVDVKADSKGNAINLTWKGSNYTLVPVSTSTGALRFEDKSSGHLWIQIPSKSFLLNAKTGQQVANECRLR